MKILIVNGFSANPQGVESFSEFQWAIKKVIEQYHCDLLPSSKGVKFTKRTRGY